VLAYRCHGKIIKCFGELAAALRQERVRGIDFAGRRIRGAYGFPQSSLTRELFRAGGAHGKMLVDEFAFFLADFIASVEN
jgi:hypothetical protein